MLSINSEESEQDFINRLSKKENLFSRQRRNGRLSALPSKFTISAVGNKTQDRKYLDAKEGQPLMDVSNQHPKDGGCSVAEENMKSTTKGVQKSTLLREFYERRRSKLNSMGPSNPRRSLATPSQNKPLLLSSRKRTPLISCTKHRNALKDNFERLGDPAVRLMFDKMRDERQKITAFKATATVRVSPSPRKRIQCGLTSAKKGSASASRKLMEISERSKARYLLRNQQNGNLTSHTAMRNDDQECCRALMFNDFEEEKETESTKPLPTIQLSTVKTCGSMLNCRRTISVKPAEHNKRDVSSSLLNEESQNAKSKSRGQDQTTNDKVSTYVEAFRRRHSAIPTFNKSFRVLDLNKRRRSAMPAQNRLTINMKESMLPIIKLNDVSRVSNPALTRQPSRRTSRIPLYAECRSPDSPKRRLCPPVILLSPATDAEIVFTDSCRKPTKKNLTKSFHDEETSLNDIGENLHNETTIIPSDSPSKVARPSKDATTNTSSIEEPYHHSLKEIESQFDKILTEQNRIEDAFESMTLGYFQKGKDLLIEYKNTFAGIRQLKDQFREELSLRNKERCNRCDSMPEKLKSSKKEYKFLGTPMPKKNKKDLVRSFSDPSSPCNRSPSVHEASFHSVDSVISPFTNIVGNCDRPSLMPMTPRMRHNVSDLKTSLNEQLEILFN